MESEVRLPILMVFDSTYKAREAWGNDLSLDNVKSYNPSLIHLRKDGYGVLRKVHYKCFVSLRNVFERASGNQFVSVVFDSESTFKGDVINYLLSRVKRDR